MLWKALEVTDAEEFRLAVRLVILDVQDVLDEVDSSKVHTRRGVPNLFESQLAALKHVDAELGKVALNRRLRALTQATAGVLPPLLTSVEQSNTESPPLSIEKCRQSLKALGGHLNS